VRCLRRWSARFQKKFWAKIALDLFAFTNLRKGLGRFSVE
jgi:hypothetical protein